MMGGQCSQRKVKVGGPEMGTIRTGRPRKESRRDALDKSSKSKVELMLEESFWKRLVSLVTVDGHGESHRPRGSSYSQGTVTCDVA